ncbi:hypothetical protein VFPPC_15522 [Pochonia chlamydosporia 170]|uniref:Uncharacterized protein n=1 Tax=Pochonia chlamydosporia 170 TaxID=1380566 RepID=A0A179FYI1_METCM|nr:hypothetical protein VFPPC_15522 [Pochonia chlamydosporia 170]OAQ70019.1 hypothetical protein VFPPC_15522 [Pochonia chlamydosporia 170]
MIQKGASSSVFLLLGGVSSLPAATLVRHLVKKQNVHLRKADLDADWEWVRLFGSAAPAIRSSRQIRSPRLLHTIPPF